MQYVMNVIEGEYKMCKQRLRDMINDIEVAYKNRNIAKARLSCEELFTYIVEKYVPRKTFNIVSKSRDKFREDAVKERKKASYWKEMHKLLTNGHKFKGKC